MEQVYEHVTYGVGLEIQDDSEYEIIQLVQTWKHRARITTLENLFFLGDGTTLNYMEYESW
jgi:hypothetical protein